MTKATVIKIVGTLASAVATGGAVFAPEAYRPVLVAFSGLVLGWLHLPQPQSGAGK